METHRRRTILRRVGAAALATALAGCADESDTVEGTNPPETEDPDATEDEATVGDEPEAADTGADDTEGDDADDTDADDTDSVDETVVVAPDGSLTFDPSNLTVAVGETVEFVWEGSGPNVNVTGRPTDGDWAGVDELRSEGHTHRRTFEVAGEYDYQCDPHQTSMVGRVTAEAE